MGRLLPNSSFPFLSLSGTKAWREHRRRESREEKRPPGKTCRPRHALVVASLMARRKTNGRLTDHKASRAFYAQVKESNSGLRQVVVRLKHSNTYSSHDLADECVSTKCTKIARERSVTGKPWFYRRCARSPNSP